MSARAFADLLEDPAGLLVIKATIVLTMACAVGALANKLSAARRHLLWLLARSSCLAL